MPLLLSTHTVKINANHTQGIINLYNAGNTEAYALKINTIESNFKIGVTDKSKCGRSLGVGQLCQLEVTLPRKSPQNNTNIEIINSYNNKAGTLYTAKTNVNYSITVTCADKEVGTSFKYNAEEYLVVDDDTIRYRKAQGKHLCTSHVTNMANLFAEDNDIQDKVANWDTSSVTDMSGMFENTGMFNQPIGDWDTSSVNDMNAMFKNTSVFNKLLDKWNTSNVINMNQMFSGAKSFSQSIGSWDVSNVDKMNSMFQQAVRFNQDLSQWNVINVKSYNGFSYMSGFANDKSKYPKFVVPEFN